MALRFLSGSNGFVPEATGQVIAFIRKPDEFPLNEYVQYVPTQKVVGLYARLGRDQMARRVADEEFAWEDGDELPMGEHQKVPFEWTEFRTYRRAYPWTLGYQSIEQATGWKPEKVHADSALSQCMTNRTKRVVDLIEASGNWGTNFATANTLNGGAGNWDTASDDPASPNFEAIYKSLIEAARRIHLATNGKVKVNDMRLVVSPGLAIKMSQAPEIINYVRETPDAMKIIENGLSMDNNLWGLPKRYRGFRVVVEDTPLVTESAKLSSGSLAEATANRVYAKADTSAVLLSRPGGLDGTYGAPSFSTVQIYHHKGLMEVRAFDDAVNERVRGAVVENIKEVVAAGVAGFLITGTL